MSRIINIYIDDDTERRLEAAAKSLGRTIDDLVESAVSEAALEWSKANPEPAGE